MIWRPEVWRGRGRGLVFQGRTERAGGGRASEEALRVSRVFAFECADVCMHA